MFDMSEPLNVKDPADIFEFTYGDKVYRMWLPVKNETLQLIITHNRTFYELDLLERLKSILFSVSPSPLGAVILDVGANIGNHTVFFAKEIGLPVFAFEPVPLVYDILQENIDLNGIRDRVTAFKAGVGAVSGAATIMLSSPQNLGGTTLRMAEEYTDDAMPIVTLDEMVGDKRVALLKIDVEGMEFDVLRGAYRLLSTQAPVLCIESRDLRHFAQVSSVLRPLGYVPVSILGEVPTAIFVSIDKSKDALEQISYELAAGHIKEFQEVMRLKSIRRRLEREVKEMRAAVASSK
ncbi:FkbM family methyltransferase [Xanthobacter agilis]|uniref:FkbM family methyltransferase n=1 Tax=Xanthobacter agilis TaxID=47492 RepID=A0ABU0LK87_XANAG|nr:FkbM family methyltransferase [Xanthobacter agilis]MDQ0507493.1 FkbM family methyltransferase [Xanthobacter agilis]